jgi:C4-dicarboxylate transporter DctQ subunit|tara:strand:- start:878 stop:1366 length:489 start_codon:yes stop_codon:yes gene_type:complete
MLNFFDTQVSRLSLFFQNIAIIAFIILTTSVIYEVIARSVFNKPTIWSLEIVTYMISCVAFFGSAYVLRINKHLEINLLTQLFSNKYRRLMKIFSDTIGLLFCLIVFFYGCKLIELSYILGVVSVSELRIPLWIPQLTIPFGFFALSLEFFLRIVKTIKKIN